MFGNLWKFSENFRNSSKVIFRCFYDFLKFSGNLRKRFLNVSIGNVHNGLQELKVLGARFWEVLK